MSVLITGANGQTSRHIISALLTTDNCPPLRLLVHSQSSKDKLASTFPNLISAPHAIFIADYLDPISLTPAFDGISVVFHDGPTFLPSQTAMGINVINAARASSSQLHIIFCSVLHSLCTTLLHHKSKLIVEEHLMRSKLNYTILQPAHFMQHVPLEPVRETCSLLVAYSPSTSHGFLDLTDFAEVSKGIILSPASHNFASYELVGENISYGSLLEMMSTILGRRVNLETVSPGEFSANMLATGAIHDEYSGNAVERMILYYRRGGLTGNSNILGWLLEREPTTWDQYLHRELKN